jgi:hypothetical protein
VKNSALAARGAATIEFALVCMVFLPFMFAVFETARMMFLWNTLPQVTRRAARAAAVTNFSDAAAMQALRQAALFRPAGGPLPLAPNVGSANIRIEYLWQDPDGTLDVLPVLPACPVANRINCTRDRYGPGCISFVRVSICGDGAGCPALAMEPMMPAPLGALAPSTLPHAVTLVTAESLGYAPGQAPCP